MTVQRGGGGGRGEGNLLCLHAKGGRFGLNVKKAYIVGQKGGGVQTPAPPGLDPLLAW